MIIINNNSTRFTHCSFYVCDTNVFISFASGCYTNIMAKPEGNKFYNEALLTLNANSTDDYIKSIYDEWAEKYDKVLCSSGFLELLSFGSGVLTKHEGHKSFLFSPFNQRNSKSTVQVRLFSRGRCRGWGQVGGVLTRNF